MVARRERFQRVYDLSERVMARMGVEPRHGALDAAGRCARTHARQRSRRWASPRRAGSPTTTAPDREHKDADLDALVESGELIRVAVDGWEFPAYVHRDHAALLQGRSRKTARHAYDRCCRRSIRWSGIAPAPARCSDSTTRSSAMCPSPSAAMAISCCRSCIAGAWSVASMPRRIAAKAASRSSASISKPVCRPTPQRIEAIARAIQACADWHETPDVSVASQRSAHVCCEPARGLANGAELQLPETQACGRVSLRCRLCDHERPFSAPADTNSMDFEHGITAIDTGFHRPRFDASHLIVESGARPSSMSAPIIRSRHCWPSSRPRASVATRSTM